MNQITVVMQGPITRWTADFAEQYAAMPSVKEVIISTWIGESLPQLKNNKTYCIQSPLPTNVGMGNRNLQIISSKKGCDYALTDWVVKVRTDMILPHLEEMLGFAQEKQTEESQIFCLSLFPTYVFHPRDWVFMGRQRALASLFDIPLDPLPKQKIEDEVLWPTQIRSETYIAGRYYGKAAYFENPRQYLMDISPKREVVLGEYHELIRKKSFFIPFPQIQIKLPKHYPYGYPFLSLKQFYGELYWDDLQSF